VAIFDIAANTKHGFCGLIFSINGPTLTRLISRLIQHYLLDPQSTQLIQFKHSTFKYTIV